MSQPLILQHIIDPLQPNSNNSDSNNHRPPRPQGKELHYLFISRPLVLQHIDIIDLLPPDNSGDNSNRSRPTQTDDETNNNNSMQRRATEILVRTINDSEKISSTGQTYARHQRNYELWCQ